MRAVLVPAPRGRYPHTVMGGYLTSAARLAVVMLWLIAARQAWAQQVTEHSADLADRPLSEVRLVGVDDTLRQYVLNNIRAAAGDPYDPDVLREDVSRLYNLGRFRFVTAEAALATDGSVIVTYSLTVQPIVQAVQSTGNRAVTDQEIRALVAQMPGLARDDYLIERAKRDIEAIYRKKGFYLTDVTIDESELDENGVLIYRIIEGPRVRVRSIDFEGVTAFEHKQVRAQITTRTHTFLLRQGILDEDVLAEDVGAIDAWYKDRGYLDVRVDRTIALSPDNSEAKVTFVVREGRSTRSAPCGRRTASTPGPRRWRCSPTSRSPPSSTSSRATCSARQAPPSLDMLERPTA
jgi:outer membrane protein insertion porin family